MVRIAEPYVMVGLRAGDEFLPPYVALGSTDKEAATREAVRWAEQRYGRERDYAAVEVKQVATGQASRTFSY